MIQRDGEDLRLKIWKRGNAAGKKTESKKHTPFRNPKGRRFPITKLPAE